MPPVDRRRPREVLGRCRHEAACGGRRPALHPDLGLSLARRDAGNAFQSTRLEVHDLDSPSGNAPQLEVLVVAANMFDAEEIVRETARR